MRSYENGHVGTWRLWLYFFGKMKRVVEGNKCEKMEAKKESRKENWKGRVEMHSFNRKDERRKRVGWWDRMRDDDGRGQEKDRRNKSEGRIFWEMKEKRIFQEKQEKEMPSLKSTREVLIFPEGTEGDGRKTLKNVRGRERKIERRDRKGDRKKRQKGRKRRNRKWEEG